MNEREPDLVDVAVALGQLERERSGGVDYRDLAERLAAALQELAGVASVCNCDEAYTSRGRHEPNAFHFDFEPHVADARAVIAAAREAGLIPETPSSPTSSEKSG